MEDDTFLRAIEASMLSDLTLQVRFKVECKNAYVLDYFLVLRMKDYHEFKT